MIFIFFMFFVVCGMSDFTCICYDYFFKDLEVIISNDMWLFGTYTKDIIILYDNPLVEVAIELKKEFKESIDNSDIAKETEEMYANFFKRWEKK